jgi:hypothetical protein
MKEPDYFQLLVDIGNYAKEKGIELDKTTVWQLMDMLSKEEGVPF